MATETEWLDTTGEEEQAKRVPGTTFLTFDPINDRVKMYKQDYVYSQPTQTGVIYDFGESKAIFFNDQHHHCYSEPLERYGRQDLDFFGQMDRLWKPENGLTKYLGKVRVVYADGSSSQQMLLFVNRGSFLQEVELGFDDNQGSLTFYFFTEKGEALPKHIVQLHSEQSRAGKTVSTYATTVPLHCHVHEWPQRQAALSGAAQVQYTDAQR